jgi:hypothetical protein
MPTARIAYVDQPFAQPRVTPDYSRLAALYQSGGAQLASLALQRGQITSSTLDRLGSLFSGFRQAQDQQKAATMALALRREEKKADLDEKAKDRTERADERKEAARLTKETQDRAAAGRLVDDTPAGPVEDTPESRVMMQLASRFPETAARFQRTQTLPARPVDPSMPSMGAPQPLVVRTPTGTEMRQAGADQRAVEAQAAAAKERTIDNSRADANLARSVADRAADNARADAMLRLAQQKADAEANDKTALTPAGIDIAALNYRKTGVMPPLGMGDKGTRQRIINRAAELTTPDIARIEKIADIAGNKQDYAANTDSLKSLQKSRDAIGAFEQTAQKNIDVFLDVAGKVVDTGSPLANKLAREVSGTLLGSPDQAAYDAARQVATNEIAKITSNPTLAGQLSDSARHEVDAFNPRNATLAQTVRVMRLLKTEMTNRKQAMDDEIAVVRGRGKTAAPATPASGQTVKVGGFTVKVKP